MTAPKRKNRLYHLEDVNIDYVHAVLFEGSPFGGQSLESLLKTYKEKGPHDPVRMDLARHLQRCAIELAQMDAFIIARANVHPNRKPRKAK